MKIAITTSSFAKFSDAPLRLLEEKGIEAVMNPYGRALTEEEAIKILSGCVGIAAGTEPLTAKVMEKCPQLKVISRCGTGMDSVDLETAKAKGIAVCNTPDGPTLAVAELVLGYALNLLRGIGVMDRDIRSGNWNKITGNLLAGKTLGIIGYGRIGRAVAKIFEGLGCDIVYYDPMVTEVFGHKSLSLDELLAVSDIVTLHCPKKKDGKALLDSEKLSLMKKGAWIINAARGGLIDEASLYAALNTKQLAGAAIDVFCEEPYAGPLTELQNIILTPHIGSYAREARIKMEVDTITNLLSALNL